MILPLKKWLHLQRSKRAPIINHPWSRLRSVPIIVTCWPGSGSRQAAARPRGEWDSYNLLGCLVVATPSRQFSYQTILKLRTDHRSDPTFGHFESTDPGNRDWKEFYENAELSGRRTWPLQFVFLEPGSGLLLCIWEYQGSGWRGAGPWPLAAQPLF